MLNNRIPHHPKKTLAMAAKSLGSLLVVACAPCGTVFAEGVDGSLFNLRGFGTLGATHSSEDQADFVGTLFQPKGAGYSEDWAFGVDSKLGVQLDARPSEKLTAVVQLVSQYGYDGTYTPRVEWANVSYQVSPDFSVRVGRIVAALFTESETRLVGYTYPWVRPPAEVYGVNPLTNKDGIDFTYRFPAGVAVNTLQLSYGEILGKLPGGGRGDVKDCLDIRHLLEVGVTALSFGYRTLELDLASPDIDTLFNGFEQFGNTVPGAAGQQALANESRFRNIGSRYDIIALGVNHNPGSWLFRAEWAKANIHNPTFVSDVTSWYVTAGYRIGPFTPFVTAAEIRPDELDTPGIPTAGLPPSLAQTAAALNGGLDAVVNAFAFDQNSFSAGIRWDFIDNAGLKIQYTRLDTGDGSTGRLANVQPGFEPGDSANVFSMTMDFVF